jgi:PIN domain nuclease of toxin-antitoxin system
MAIKVSLGKLKLNHSLADLIDRAAMQHIDWLPLEPPAILVLQNLPFHHRDPFDRTLIVQAIADNLVLISRDSVIDDYGISRLWK